MFVAVVALLIAFCLLLCLWIPKTKIQPSPIKVETKDISEYKEAHPVTDHIPVEIGELPETQLPQVDMPRVQLLS